MFNSPLQYCPGCKQYVELDQTREECAQKHGCHDIECPLVKQFAPPPPSDDEQPPAAKA